MKFTIRRIDPADWDAWLRMRVALWPDASAEEHESEMQGILADPESPVFLAIRADGQPGGFLEGGIRKYADGCESGPVGYIEGWYVEADLRRQGVGGALIGALEEWARERGLKEMASDTWLDNETSITAHKKLGYDEAERLVHFVKKLT